MISDYQAVRHYCKSQMGLMWLHMSTSLSLTDEQLSLLVVRSMQRMIQVTFADMHIIPSGLFSSGFVLAVSQQDYFITLRVVMGTRETGMNGYLHLHWRRSELR